MNINDINYDSVKYFCSVAEHGSILRASQHLEISQSALSQSMKNLEDSLNVKLFFRNTRGIILTNEGKILYEYAKVGNFYFKEAITNTVRIKNQNILKYFKISASHFIKKSYIFPIMNNFVKKCDNINFDFIPNIPEKDIVKKLQNKDADIIFLKVDSDFCIKEISSSVIVENTYSFLYNPEYFNFQSYVELNNLKNVPVIIKERDGKNDSFPFKTYFNKIIVCHHDDSVLDLIKNGVGIGLYPEQLLKKYNLKKIELKNYKPIKRTIMAFYLETNFLAKDMINEIVKNLNNI